MNKILTKTVLYRGKEVPVSQLSDQSQIVVEVECPHGVRKVRYSRRNQLCRKCSIEAGVFNTSKPGREITWGNKISDAKKGISFSEEHRKALLEVRKRKLMKKRKEHVFSGFPSHGLQGKIRNRISNNIRTRLKTRLSSKKKSSILKYLPYTIEELISHLESKFQSGMSWDNYGKWHIDHIVPDSWFKYDSMSDEAFQKCWALNNLQPMWAKDNLSKSNHFIG